MKDAKKMIIPSKGKMFLGPRSNHKTIENRFPFYAEKEKERNRGRERDKGVETRSPYYAEESGTKLLRIYEQRRRKGSR